MSSPSFTLTLIPEQRSGRFILTCDRVSYPLEFRPETDIILGDLLRRLRPVLVGGHDPSEKFTSSELLHEVGTRLWQALLSDAVPAEKREALEQELRTGMTPLLLALPASLSTLPWELLCDPLQPLGSGYLACRRPLSRLIPGDTALKPPAPILRVLLLISSPPGLPEEQRVDVESERAAVENATRKSREVGYMHLQVEDFVTPQRVARALLDFKPHILHYIGHGNYDENKGGFLLWEDEQGEPLPLFSKELADLLRSHGLRTVLLHGCKTASNDHRADFGSVAGVLLDDGIPAVLAQQASFTYESSLRASEMFYTTLVSGFGLAEAIFEVRQALMQANRPDWAVPILQATAGGLAPLLDVATSSMSPDPALSSNSTATDLPAPIGSFVGRQRELRVLRKMLESAPGTGPALALITGPGGIGKSTLAAQAITRYGKQYKAVLTLSCVAYQGMDLFLQHLAERLNHLAAPELLEQVLPDPKLNTEAKIELSIKILNDAGPFLLLIDNFESSQQQDRTIIDPELQLFLQKLLTNLHSGCVLVTGRYVVEDLIHNDQFTANLVHLVLDDLTDREIFQLLDRDYSLSHLGDTVRSMLVEEFGGLPFIYDLLSSIAIKNDLADLIHDAQGRITRERQQRSDAEWQQIRRQVVEFAALETIVTRLPEPARILLAHLSIFRHPFPLQALDNGLGATLDQWQPLLDWAILRYEPEIDAYHLHGLTRRYAETLLDTAGRATTQVQLAEWYLSYARNESHDLSDYLEAHYLLRMAGEIERADRLALSLTNVFYHFGLYQLWQDLCMTTIADLSDRQSELGAEALRELGAITSIQGQYEKAQEFCKESLTIFERLNDQRGQASTLYQLGIINLEQDRYEEARHQFEESLAIFEQMGDQNNYLLLQQALGHIAASQGEYKEASYVFSEGLKSQSTSSNQIDHALALHNLGLIARLQGKYEQARSLVEESLAILERIGDRVHVGKSIYELGMLAWNQGQYEEAGRLLTNALTFFERSGLRQERAMTLHSLANIAFEQGRYEEAQQLYSECLLINERLGVKGLQARTLGNLANIAIRQEKYEEAQRLHEESLMIFKQLGDQRGCAATMHSLGNIALEQGNLNEASHLFNEALRIFEQLGDQRGYASAWYSLGSIAIKRGVYEEGLRILNEALKIFEQLGDQLGQVNILIHLGNLAFEQEDYKQAQNLYERSLAIAEQQGLQNELANVLHSLGNMAFEQERYIEAKRFFREDLSIKERLGDQPGCASTLMQLGRIAEEQGEYEEAQRIYEKGLVIWKKLGDQGRPGIGAILMRLGMIALAHGEYEEGRRLHEESLIIFEQMGNLRGCAVILHTLGFIAFDQRQYDEAQHLYNQCLVIEERLDDQGERATTLRVLGDIANLQGKDGEARQFYETVLTIPEQLAGESNRARVLYNLGSLARRRHEYGIALGYLVHALMSSEHLTSSLHDSVLRSIDELRTEVGEENFKVLWQQVGEGRSQPDLSITDHSRDPLQDLITFINSKTWDEAQRFLETHPALLEIGVGILLDKWIEIEQDEERREWMDMYRMLLMQCRTRGIATGFAEFVAKREQQLNDPITFALCALVVATLRDGGPIQRWMLNTYIDQVINPELAQRDEQLFLSLLSAWLRGENITSKAKLLQQDLLNIYTGMLAEVEQVSQSKGDLTKRIPRDEWRMLLTSDLLKRAAMLLAHGTMRGLQLFGEQLSEWRSGLPFEEVPLGTFLLCLIAMLRGEEPDTISLVAPYDELWRQFQSTIDQRNKVQEVDENYSLLQHLIAFIQAPTWSETQKIVEFDSALLNPQSDILLEQLERAQQDKDAREVIEQHRRLLAQCREVGIARAFAGLQEEQEPNNEDEFSIRLNKLCNLVMAAQRANSNVQWQLLAKNLDDLIASDKSLEDAHDFLALLAAWLRGEDIASDVESLTPSYRNAFKRMETLAGHIDQSYNDREEISPADTQFLLEEFAKANWTQRQQLLEEYADVLLSKHIDSAIDALLTGNSDSDLSQLHEELQACLRRCRAWGADAVQYLEQTMYLGDGITIPPEYESTVLSIAASLSRCEGNQRVLVDVIQTMQTLLKSLTAEKSPLFEGALLHDLVVTMARLPADHPNRQPELMEVLCRRALVCYQSADRPLSVAYIQRTLGHLLSQQGRYEEALEPLRTAAETLKTSEMNSLDAAVALSSYASALMYLGKTDESLTTHLEAIRILQEDVSGEYTLETAYLLSENAEAVGKLGMIDEALAAHTEALRLAPQTSLLYRGRAATLIHARKIEEAEQDLALAIDLDGSEDSLYLWYYRAQIAITRGDALVANQMLDEVFKRDASVDLAFLRAQAAWIQGDLQTAQDVFRKAWEKADLGERTTIHREMEQLFTEHPELYGRGTLYSIMRKVDE